MTDDIAEHFKKEILELRELIKAQAEEIIELRLSTARANTMVNAVRDAAYDLAANIGDVQDKVSHILFNNPRIVADIARLEDILGPADQPTPGAPPLS